LPPLKIFTPVLMKSISTTRGRLRGASAPLLKDSPSPNILTFEIRARLLFGEGDTGGKVLNKAKGVSARTLVISHYFL